MNIKYNSKKIQKGDTFIALKTNNDGHKYINDAIKNGATKVGAEYGSYPVETLLVDNTKEYLVKYLYENYYQEGVLADGSTYYGYDRSIDWTNTTSAIEKGIIVLNILQIIFTFSNSVKVFFYEL